MAKLKPQGSAARRRPPADVILKYDQGRRSIVCDGHLDEVTELRRGGQKLQGEAAQAGGGLTWISSLVPLEAGQWHGDRASRVC